MALHYTEFDSTTQYLLADLQTEILQSSDWAQLSSSAVLGTSTVAVTTSNNVLTVADAAAMGLSVGMSIAIDNGALREYRTISAITTNTQLAFNGTPFTYAHGVGTQIRSGHLLFKATTTRGAQMVVDLNDTALDGSNGFLGLATYASHDGTTGVGKALKYLMWRYNDGAPSNQLHITLSLGKEHFFLMIEGPRAGESGAVSAQYGSFRNYFFLSDVVPYDEEDVIPIVFAGGANQTSFASSVAYSSHLGHMSKNLAGTSYWSPSRVASLQFIQGGESSVLNLQRRRTLDDRYILAPYVVFGDESGMRGRLSSLFFAGINQTSDYSVAPPPLGDKVQYQGLWYKLIAVNKGDGNRAAWGALGAVNNDTLNTHLRSVVVGVPCPP